MLNSNDASFPRKRFIEVFRMRVNYFQFVFVLRILNKFHYVLRFRQLLKMLFGPLVPIILGVFYFCVEQERCQWRVG